MYMKKKKKRKREIIDLITRSYCSNQIVLPFVYLTQRQHYIATINSLIHIISWALTVGNRFDFDLPDLLLNVPKGQ